MKDQNSADEIETKKQKWDRAHALFLESLYKPDHALRGCAHNQKCFHELMEIKDEVIEIVKDIANPHKEDLKFGQYNPDNKVESINGISVTLLGGTLGDHYKQQMNEES